MKIQDMPAGPEMDRLVAEKVMRWGSTACGSFANGRGRGMESFFPSTEIDHAWEVVERVIDIRLPRRSDGFPPSTVFTHHFQKAHLWAMSAKDAAAEICRSALLAVGCEVAP